MKSAFVCLVIALIQLSCRNAPTIYLKHNNHKKSIALQPIGKRDQKQLSLLQTELSRFFHIKVLVLDSIEIEPTLQVGLDKGYNADSVLPVLLKETNDSIVQIVGITNNQTYILKKSIGQVNHKADTLYYYDDVFGYSFLSEKACLVSDYKLISNDTALWRNRLRKVAIHEIGHCLGLSHCPTDDCLMSEKYGNIANLNKPGGDYCSLCKKKLN